MTPGPDAPTVPEWAAPTAAPEARPLDLPELPSAIPVRPGPGPSVAGTPKPPGWDLGYQEGFDEGLQTGIAEGQRIGADQARSEMLACANATLEELRRSVSERLAEWNAACDRLASQVVELALELAELVVDHDVAARSQPGLDAVTRAVRFAPPEVPLVVRLHPDDAKGLDLDALGDDRDLRVVADSDIRRGGCLLSGGDTTVDATVDGAIRRLRTLLTPSSTPATPSPGGDR